MTAQIIKNYEKVDLELVEKFGQFEESASIHESMGRNALGAEIRPVWPGARLCGRAFTVEARPGDNLIVHKALSMLQPGDVLVIKSGLNDCGGLWGGMMTASAKAKGCAGLVTDGAVRDTMLIKKLEFPVFSKRISVRSTTKGLPGKINHPIVIDDVIIRPGDLIFGDNDAVVVVPREEAQEVFDRTMAREVKESALLKRIQAGEGTTFELSGFNKKFEALGQTEEE